MKRVLLVSLTLIFSGAVLAQSVGRFTEVHSNEKAKKEMLSTDGMTHQLQVPSTNESVLRVATRTTIGNSSNPFTGVGFRSPLTYDPDLGAMVLIHRQDPAVTGNGGTSGWITYGISTDDGDSWTSHKAILWNNTAGTNARYPQGFLLNPAGNTDPNNAHVAFIGPTLEGTNGASWGGVGYGSMLVSDTGTASNQVLFTSDTGSGRLQYIPDGGTVANGKIWVVDVIPDWGAGGGAYTDSLAVYVGEINGNQVDFTETRIYEPLVAGSPISGECIAFSPDGMTGYIGAVGRVDAVMTPDEVYSIMFKKTTDGGATWSSFTQVPFDTTQIIAELGPSGGNPVSTAFDLDMVVDKNGNPHFYTNVGFGPGAGYTIFGVSTGMYHVHSMDGGATFRFDSIRTTHDFRGYWGDAANNISEDNRPQISRDSSGSYIMMAHFDVDTNFVYTDCAGGAGGNAPCGNIDRLIHLAGYNVDKDLTTPSLQQLGMTDAFNLAFEMIADVSISTSTGVEVPFSYQVMNDRSNYVSPTTHYYETDLGFTYEELGDTLATSLDELPEVSDLNIFPNPSKGTLNVAFNAHSSSVGTIEVLNLLGQEMKARESVRIGEGFNRFQLDLNTLSKGIYLVRLGTNGNFSTHKVVLE